MTVLHTAIIKGKCPWFFHLKAIIDERPSLVPAGIGNNSSGYDISVLIPSTTEFDSTSNGSGLDDNHEALKDKEDKGGSEEVIDKGLSGSDSDEDVVVKGATQKRKAVALDSEPEKGIKTSARKGKSIHATAPKKSKTAAEKIATIAEKEEETAQKVLDLKRLKVKGENDKELARIKAKADVKIQQMKLKAELAQKKLDHEFQLQMARIGCSQTQPEVEPERSSMGLGMFGTVYSDQALSTPGPSISDTAHTGLGTYDGFNFSNLS